MQGMSIEGLTSSWENAFSTVREGEYTLMGATFKSPLSYGEINAELLYLQFYVVDGKLFDLHVRPEVRAAWLDHWKSAAISEIPNYSDEELYEKRVAKYHEAASRAIQMGKPEEVSSRMGMVFSEFVGEADLQLAMTVASLIHRMNMEIMKMVGANKADFH